MIRPPLPAAFDADTYRRENPDLALGDDAEAARHFEAHGRAAGRIASPLARREGLIAAIDDGMTLEIGPFCSPLLRGANVEYLDKLDPAQLRARAIKLGIDPAGCPERIHHLGGLETVSARYANIVASHSIEHQPDLVRHLEQIGRLLEPGGRYWLIVPDKRYCFDHFLPESSIAQVLQAFHEARRVHSLQSVIEHVALVTHNDPQRHWAGDHIAATLPPTAQRVTEAIQAYRNGEGGYVDVHAWQFTPESFRRLMETLNALGHGALDVEQVYDTPHGRLEFCAALRRPLGPTRLTPRGSDGGGIIMMQTADPYRYAAMLAATAPSVTEYCRRFGMRYESFTGVKRGHFNWQATFNRIVMLKELLDRGFDGWAVYLDADAYVHDLGFDLPAYIAANSAYGAIFATSGVTGEPWDVNAGVAFINLGHPQGRRLVQAWADAFDGVSDDRLRAGETWFEADNDQDLLHAILRRDTAIAAATRIESMDFINSRHARFIRQHLRAQTGNLAARIAAIAADVHAVLIAWGAERSSESRIERMDRARLRNAVGVEPFLVECAVALPRDDLAAAAIGTFKGRATAPATPALTGLATLLAGGDVNAVAGELAALGRSPAGQGLLGGRRQHDRVAGDPSFAHQRALQTYDALVSLAEVTGAVAIRQPDDGEWGANAALPPEALFAALSERLTADLSPPPTIGGYLGIPIDYERVLHGRVIEAIHAAWRARQLLRQVGGSRIVEMGGGAGLTAWYAHALGSTDYTIADDALLSAIQRYVLGDRPTIAIVDPAQVTGPADVMFSEDSLGDRGEPYVAAAFDLARRCGVQAVLSLNADAGGDSTDIAAVAASSGWRRVSRHPHALRPGFVDEVFMPD